MSDEPSGGRGGHKPRLPQTERLRTVGFHLREVDLRRRNALKYALARPDDRPGREGQLRPLSDRLLILALLEHAAASLTPEQRRRFDERFEELETRPGQTR